MLSVPEIPKRVEKGHTQCDCEIKFHVVLQLNKWIYTYMGLVIFLYWKIYIYNFATFIILSKKKKKCVGTIEFVSHKNLAEIALLLTRA